MQVKSSNEVLSCPHIFGPAKSYELDPLCYRMLLKVLWIFYLPKVNVCITIPENELSESEGKNSNLHSQ